MGVEEDRSLNPKPESSMIFFCGWERELTHMTSFFIIFWMWVVFKVFFSVLERSHIGQVLVFWTCWQIDMYALRMP